MKKTELNRKTPLRKISKKMKQQCYHERVLKKQIVIEQWGYDGRGLCLLCMQWAKLEKHEIVFRSQMGSAVDRNNCICLCGYCHSLITNSKIKLEIDGYDLIVHEEDGSQRRIANYAQGIHLNKKGEGEQF